MPFLTPGTYSVRVTLDGFTPSNNQCEHPTRPDGRSAVDDGCRRYYAVCRSASHCSDRRSIEHERRLEPDRRAAPERARGAAPQRHAVSRAGREQQRRRRTGQSVDWRRQRARQPIRHRRREHYECRLWLAGFVLDRVWIARQRHTVRLHPGGRGQDGRVRSRVRPVDGRRRERHHQERHQPAARQRVLLLQARRPGKRLHADRLRESVA